MKKIILLGMFVFGFTVLATAQTETPAQEAPVKACCKAKAAGAGEPKACCKGKAAQGEGHKCEHKEGDKATCEHKEGAKCEHKSGCEGKKAECHKPAAGKASGKASIKTKSKSKSKTNA